MCQEAVSAFRDQYELYRQLLREHKYVYKEVIEVTRSAPAAGLLEEKAYVTHIDLPSEMTLLISVRPNDHKFFRFKLRCGDLSGQPFFGYESDGSTRRNFDESIPLGQQRVTTPYFHHYNNRGVTLAYKTDALLNEQQRKTLEDINRGMQYFCQEAKLNLRDDEFPEVSILPASLPLRIIQEDPNSTVLFL